MAGGYIREFNITSKSCQINGRRPHQVPSTQIMVNRSGVAWAQPAGSRRPRETAAGRFATVAPWGAWSGERHCPPSKNPPGCPTRGRFRQSVGGRILESGG